MKTESENEGSDKRNKREKKLRNTGCTDRLLSQGYFMYVQQTHTHKHSYHCRLNSYELYHDVTAVNGSDTPFGIAPKKEITRIFNRLLLSAASEG